MNLNRPHLKLQLVDGRGVRMGRKQLFAGA